VNRVVKFLGELSEWKLDTLVYDEIKQTILNKEVMPSMRLMATAGAAARRNNISCYNCAYTPITSIMSIAEILMILISGTGVGYSVERSNISQLSTVTTWKDYKPNTWIIDDSSEGWYAAFAAGLSSWWNGFDIVFDYSQIRPTGAVLKTKGGRASGPDPLRKLLDFSRETLFNAQGRKLTSLEVHDIVTMIGECIVSGGHRRSAMIALFDYDDHAMATCKNGETFPANRYNANNSAVWTRWMGRDEVEALLKEMDRGGMGEPGLFNRESVIQQQARLGRSGIDFGANPCGEILLRGSYDKDTPGGQFCNLSSVTAREDDTLESLARKVRVATIIGTIQSLADSFPLLRDGWHLNAVKERLLGVDLNGIYDCPALLNATGEELEWLRGVAHTTNSVFAEKLGINKSPAITCVKPSGNTSVLLDTSSGIHPRYARYYIRRVRLNGTDPVLALLKDQGMTAHRVKDNGGSYVVEFPVKAPGNAVTRDTVTALSQLDTWLKFKRHWTDHNPSATIYYTSDELDSIIDFVYDNQGYIGGLSFLPRDDHKYEYAPYEEIDAVTYYEREDALPDIDFSKLADYEEEDMTVGSQEYACVGDKCDV
jgi:ribonucleoside-diphosphate reductase alpha chain